MALALFDLDNTLLHGDSDWAWGKFLYTQKIVDEHYRTRNQEFYTQYAQGTLDIAEYIAFLVEPLKRHTHQQLQALRQKFMEQAVTQIILPKAQKLLASHRQQGHYLLIITASNTFITEPIAQYFGVDTLLGTDLECIQESYTGRIAGVPAFREGKVEKLDLWLKGSEHTLSGSYFYSDSHNDLPLLEHVEHPVAVDPDPQLRDVANQRGWPVISLRDAP